MPDTWEILFDNSTLPSGDAWEHLNNQAGGGTVEYVPVLNEVEVETPMDIEVCIESKYPICVEVEPLQNIEVGVDSNVPKDTCIEVDIIDIEVE